MTAIVWLRRDLRVHDHPALCAALAEHEHVVPVFCLDDRLLHGRHASGPRTQFLLESLADIDARLRERGAALVVRRGRPEDELPSIAGEAGADAVYASADVTPYARARDEALPLELRTYPGVTVVDDVGALRTNAGGAYGVFSPFERSWRGEPRRDILPAPRRITLPGGIDAGRFPSLEELGLRQEVEDPIRGGETEARRRLTGFMSGPIDRYQTGRDVLADDGTSRLSAYLHLGCVSPREVEARLPSRAGAGSREFRRQLAWRDFHHHVLLESPSNAREEHQERYRGTLDWDGDDELFDAWREGCTGYPLVDAGMRSTWSASTPTAATCAAGCPSSRASPTSTCASHGRCRPRSSVRPVARSGMTTPRRSSTAAMRGGARSSATARRRRPPPEAAARRASRRAGSPR